ncbi:MAG: hypothetical protein JWM53_6339, partial [bacterium]|nr:hypothetical protein [bacterium]
MSFLDLPYAEHPEFQFGPGEIDLDPAPVEAFAAAYQVLERSDSSLPPFERKQLEDRAFGELARIFDALAQHDHEATYRTFIDELRSECQRVLAADLRHFAGRDAGIAANGDAKPPRLLELENNKFFIGRISDHCVDALLRVIREPVTALRAKAAIGKVTRDDLSINHGVVPRDIVRALNPEFERLGVNDVVSTYAQKRMAVCGVALELSVPAATWWRNQYRVKRPPHTLYA